MNNSAVMSDDVLARSSSTNQEALSGASSAEKPRRKRKNKNKSNTSLCVGEYNYVFSLVEYFF